MKYPSHDSCVSRLRKIEGQVRGISRMIEDRRYCTDILIQLQAVVAALGQVENAIIKDHVNHCVSNAIAEGTAEERKQKFDEIVHLLLNLNS